LPPFYIYGGICDVDMNQPIPYMTTVARMAELVDALVSGISA
jgi:hypothetical protein